MRRTSTRRLLAAAVILAGCGGQHDVNAPDAEHEANARIAGYLAGTDTPDTRADSTLVIRHVARQLALAMGDRPARDALYRALQRSTVREGKLQLQRFLRQNGAALGQAVNAATGAPTRSWERTADLLPDLEIYLPVPAQRAAWTADSDLVVTGFLDSDEAIAAAGGVLMGYDTRGQTVTLDARTPPTRPVLVIYPVETSFAEDGESPASGTASGGAASFKIDPGPQPPPPPLPPCPSRGSGSSFYLCKSVIPNVSQYESWPRGSPEIAMSLESIETNAQGYAVSKTRLGCINEDMLLGSSTYFNQDADTWGGSAFMGTKAALDNARAQGRTVILTVWEDDQNSKCDFEPEEDSHNSFGRLAGVGYLIFVASGGDPANWAPGLFIGSAMWGIGVLFAAGDQDDWVGEAGLPLNADPLAVPINIIQSPSDIRGTLYFHVR